MKKQKLLQQVLIKRNHCCLGNQTLNIYMLSFNCSGKELEKFRNKILNTQINFKVKKMIHKHYSKRDL